MPVKTNTHIANVIANRSTPFAPAHLRTKHEVLETAHLPRGIRRAPYREIGGVSAQERRGQPASPLAPEAGSRAVAAAETARRHGSDLTDKLVNYADALVQIGRADEGLSIYERALDEPEPDPASGR
jgi:hypothetical protein